jgi:SAM-dependent methyltransferase
MKTIFGTDLSAIYNEKWGNYGVFAWPFIRKQVERRNRRASTWLDLCCGTGAFLKVAAQDGFTVAGVDQSADLIKYARNNAPEAELMVQDIRSLSTGHSFDVITCLGDSLNYLTACEDLARVFRNASECLSANGLFIFDMMTFEGLKSNWRGTEVIHDPDKTFIMETTFDPETVLGRYLFTGFVSEGGLYRRFQEEHLERGYRPEEIEGHLMDAGFVFRKYDGHTLVRAKRKSDRLLYFCSRCETPHPRTIV